MVYLFDGCVNVKREGKKKIKKSGSGLFYYTFKGWHADGSRSSFSIKFQTESNRKKKWLLKFIIQLDHILINLLNFMVYTNTIWLSNKYVVINNAFIYEWNNLCDKN